MMSLVSMRPPMSPAPGLPAAQPLQVPSLVLKTWKFRLLAMPFQPAATSAARSMENSTASSSELK